MQEVTFQYARKTDKELLKKLKKKHDTRAAAVLQTVSAAGTEQYIYMNIYMTMTHFIVVLSELGGGVRVHTTLH